MNTITLKATVNGSNYEHEFDVISEDGLSLTLTARGYLDRGIQKVLTDASSTLKEVATGEKDGNDKAIKRDATPEDKAAAVQTRLDKLIAGTYSFGGGGGGALSPHDKAIRQILQDSGYKGWAKLADESVDSALETFTKTLAEKQDIEWDESFIEDMRQKIEGVSNFAEIVAEHQPKKKIKATIGVTLAD